MYWQHITAALFILVAYALGFWLIVLATVNFYIAYLLSIPVISGSYDIYFDVLRIVVGKYLLNNVFRTTSQFQCMNETCWLGDLLVEANVLIVIKSQNYVAPSGARFIRDI
ncbi:hypothetical protein T4D_14006 [Trichinella pseudospiralis]|uniref:Uncharacterized protein n=1 Tax=Trichinella pseudospiralis TaxID=6337 RepID=A0A0V1F7H7_TRIPS|nr:hypothetical protein T4D_14006 [Trichinella pseudospiralis]